jgi:hypothetical protein
MFISIHNYDTFCLHHISDVMFSQRSEDYCLMRSDALYFQVDYLMTLSASNDRTINAQQLME